MAAVVKLFSLFGKPAITCHVRNYSLKVKKPVKIKYAERKFEFDAASLRTRGFLRSTKAYDPPFDARDRIKDIVTKLGIPHGKNAIKDPALRFQLLNECYQTFQHSIPNSILHTITTVGDVIDYYQTPVDDKTPYDALKTMDLPKNLHIQQDYVRFNKDTDTMFGGQTAFPRSSTLVTGLKYKKKYPNNIVPTSWPYN